MFSFLTKQGKLLLAVALFFLSCRKENNDPSSAPILSPYTITYPEYLPEMPLNPSNVLSKEGIALGKKLYNDKILSKNLDVSCSSCHVQNEAYSLTSANSLPHINLGWNQYFLWNGKIKGTLEDAMVFEVEDFFKTEVSRLNNSNEYKKEFKTVFGEDNISSKQIAYAIAQYARTLVSCDSKFDQFVQHKTMLTPEESNGFTIFNTEKGDCFHCHSLGLFSDNKFHNIGLDSFPKAGENSRFDATGDPIDMGKYKTPTLRNISHTPPYMHDGRFKTLEEVVEHYNSGVKHSKTLDPIMTKPTKEFGLQLTNKEKSDLIAFLKTLTDSSFIKP